ncbi:hypothetical protein [Burkholderia sp. AW49-1]
MPDIGEQVGHVFEPDGQAHEAGRDRDGAERVVTGVGEPAMAIALRFQIAEDWGQPNECQRVHEAHRDRS